jgi:hypothetical protein
MRMKWALVMAILLPAAVCFAQIAAFETASIAPSTDPTGRSTFTTTASTLSLRNQTLKDCIRIAYDVKVAQVSGARSGPSRSGSMWKRKRSVR